MDCAAWTDRYWTSGDGLRLHYRDYAGPDDRPAIVCLHGLTRNSRDFEGFAERLAGSWRVITPDFRGRGESEWDANPAHYTPPVYATDVLQLLDLLALKRCVFVGTSLGGLVTMVVAAIAPDRGAAAVLNDVGPELDRAALDRIAAYVGQHPQFDDWHSAAAAVAAINGAAHPAYRAEDWLRMARRVCTERDGQIRFDYDPAIADNFRFALQKPSADAWPIFASLRHCPILILRGELSDLLSPEVAERMAAEHGAAELVTVPGVGHAPDLSEPAALGAIDRLLGRVRP